ncbi:30S ribosomal protein S18 [Rhodococcus erythropolis]|uniref:Small ribosomal subunit protein bS18 n=1 Tax=Rhodococcus erythropolis TaxID=1833 RepID=A0A6G9CYJ0_RHOER|nr:30S ribosomal protein S18 [Rhodococcus erythropolis]
MAVKRSPSKKPRPVEGRKPKKNPLFAAKITHVDYKDINLLRTFISDRGKIRSRRVTGPDPAAAASGRRCSEERTRNGVAPLHRRPVVIRPR